MVLKTIMLMTTIHLGVGLVMTMMRLRQKSSCWPVEEMPQWC